MSFSKSLLTFLLAGFLSILAVGCGNSSDEFVATGGNTSVIPNGNLTFRFTRAVAQQEVPADTIQLAFALHSDSPASTANLVETRLEPYADVVVLEDVDPSVVLVIVTALGPDGLPLVAFEAPAVVVPGTTQEVELGTGETVSFDSLAVFPQVVNVVSDGDGVQLQFTLSFGNDSEITLSGFDAPEASFSQDMQVANISSTGLITTDMGGLNTTATANYELLGTTQSDTFSINTYSLELFNYDPPNIAGSGSSTDGLEVNVRYAGPNGVVLNFDENDPEFDNVTFALETAVTGVSIDENTGALTGMNVPVDTDISILVTYTDPDTNFPVTVTRMVTTEAPGG